MHSAKAFAESFADFVAGRSRTPLPQDVMDRAKDVLLDTIAVALHGASSPWAISAREALVAGSGSSLILGTAKQAPATLAAFANGVSAHSYDFDDVHNASITHPAATIVPAALAVAEERASSGAALLTAIALGYEIVARVGMALDPLDHRSRGFHPTGTCGPFGSALAVGCLLGLPAERLAWALGIAGSTSSGLMEYWQDGAMTKRLHPGQAAMNGIVAARLAAAGMTGPVTIFEGKSGTLHAFSDRPHPELILKDLGERFTILDSQIKLYACRSGLHTTLDALLSLRKEHRIDPGGVAHIRIGHIRKDRTSDRSTQPKNTLEAQMSLPFTIALAMYTGSAWPDDYSDENLANPDIRRLAGKVEAVFEPELFTLFERDPLALPSSVEITLKDGRSFFRRNDYPPDGPGCRIGAVAVREKFQRLATPVIGDRKTSRAIAIIDEIERHPDLGELAETLRSQ